MQQEGTLRREEPFTMLKRSFDFVSSLFGLILISPVLVTLAILIKKEDGGPVFYRGVRVGRFGKPFRIFKFRTMVVNAEKLGGPSTADDDPRITKVGKFIRKFKLDELPQLINVLKGRNEYCRAETRGSDVCGYVHGGGEGDFKCSSRNNRLGIHLES